MKALKFLFLQFVISFSFLASHEVRAQFSFEVVQDKPVNGQLKRMVFLKWNDWQPSTRTVLGIPTNLQGFLFWKVLNRQYHNGEDRRPYRLPDGPFMRNYLDLTLQETSDDKIMDTTEKIAQTHAATYLNMSGGEADIAYSLFFKRKFQEIYTAINEFLTGMQQESPRAWEACLNSTYFNQFLEYLEVTKDRVKATNDAFVDKGVRLETYITIYKELSLKYRVFSKYLAGQVLLAKIPQQRDLDQVVNIPVFNKDRDIVRYILSTYKF